MSTEYEQTCLAELDNLVKENKSQQATIAELEEKLAIAIEALEFIAERSKTHYECEVCATEAFIKIRGK